MTAHARPLSSAAVPAVGAVRKRILGRDTDAYSQAQFAKPGVPKTHWNQDDQAKSATGELPTRCGCTRLTVMPHEGIRCYLLSIPSNTVRVELFKDADAIVLIRKVVPNLDEMQARDTVEFDPPCQISFKPVHEGMITRKKLLTFEQPPAAPKKATPAVEEKPVKPVDDLPPGMTQQLAPMPKSDVETWFGPKTAKRAPWGSEGEAVKADSKPYSVKNHFRRELLNKNPNADPAAVALNVLGMTIEESCEKIGVSPTIDKLQVYLDAKPEEITVVAPATTETLRNEVLDMIEDAFPLASSEYKASIVKSAIGHARIADAQKAGMTDAIIKVAIRNEIATIKTLEKNLPPADESETHAVDAASAPVAPTEATPVPPTPSGATAGKVEPQAGHATAYPNYPESPIIVYPMDRGGIVYKGIRFSVTLRLGGTWAMALVLMDDFAAHRECIDPSCLVRPMQTAATGGSTAPRDEDAPPDDSDNSEPQYQSGGGEEHENGTAIMRSVEGNKTTYTIWYNAGSTETKYPKKINNPQGLKLLETALRAAGRNPDKWENGKRYNSVKVNVWWKQGKLIEGTTKHYIDWTRFEVVKEVEEVPA